MYKISNSNIGTNNPFYGHTHSEKSKQKISIANSGRDCSDETKKKMSDSRIGVKKTNEHKNKIGRKGYIMLKNVNTNECIRINKHDKMNYDPMIWLNPYTIKCMNETVTVKHSDETKSKIGRKGYIMLKNIETLENIRILKTDQHKYESTIWMNPATVKKLLKERNK